jgi:L-iditol 2-dehydrogenase
MIVLRLHQANDLRLHEEPTPEPKPGEELLRISAVGICGSDLHWFAESGIGDARLERPLVLGHEFAGVVETGALRGQRAAVDPNIPCRVCEFCLEGNPNFCLNHHFAGHGKDDGALRQYLTWPSDLLHPLPDNLTDIDGAMLEPLGVALHAVDLGKLRPGMTIGVFGCGPIGLLIVQLALLSGAAQIIATDRAPHRLDAARSFGASQVLQVDDGRETGSVMAAVHQRGVDVAFEVAGEDAAVQTAITAAKPGGRVILVGIPTADQTTFSASTARRKGLTIKLVRRMKNTYPRAIRLVAANKIDVRSLVTHILPLEQAQQAFDLANRREGIKVIISVG